MVALSCLTNYLCDILVWELIKLRHFTFLAFYYCSPATIPQAWPCRYKTKWNVLMSNKCNLQNKYSQTKYRFRVVSELRIWIAIWSKGFFQLNNFPGFFHGELKCYDKEKKVVPCKKKVISVWSVLHSTVFDLFEFHTTLLHKVNKWGKKVFRHIDFQRSRMSGL